MSDFRTRTRGRCSRCAGSAIVLVLALLPTMAAGEPVSLTSRVEDNRTERAHENLTAQGSWAGTVQIGNGGPTIPEPAPLASQTQTLRPPSPKPAHKRVQLRNKPLHAQPAQPRPLNFNDIRRRLAWN